MFMPDNFDGSSTYTHLQWRDMEKPSAPQGPKPTAEKKIPAGICGILLGMFGIHKFILGYTKEGLIMMMITFLTFGVGGIVMGVIGLIEGITYLTKSDEAFIGTYVTGRKGWF